MNRYYPPYPPPPHWYQPPAGYQATPASLYTPPPVAMAPPAVAGGNLLTRPSFVKGALVGAVVAYLLTNEKVQQNAIKAAVKSWTLLQGGVEEMKERFRDAEAELHATNMGDEE